MNENEKEFGYLTSACEKCTHWSDDIFSFGCTRFDPYACIHVKRLTGRKA